MPENLADLPLWYFVFLFSTTCHEAAHAWAAKLGGDLTAYEGGQVTLNPVPHIQREPLGTVVVPLLSFILTKGSWLMGWASAPYDPTWRMRYPKRAAWMALAGPLANFALLVLAGVAIHIGIAMEAFQPPQRIGFDHVVSPTAAGLPTVLATLFSIFFSMNLLLGTFNLLPFPPLDGNTAIGLFLSDKAAQWFTEFSSNPMFSWIGLLVAWKVYGAVFSPAFLFAINLLYPAMSYR